MSKISRFIKFIIRKFLDLIDYIKRTIKGAYIKCKDYLRRLIKKSINMDSIIDLLGDLISKNITKYISNMFDTEVTTISTVDDTNYDDVNSYYPFDDSYYGGDRW